MPLIDPDKPRAQIGKFLIFNDGEVRVVDEKFPTCQFIMNDKNWHEFVKLLIKEGRI